MTGFTTDVATIDKVATHEIPAVADALRRPIGTITDHTPMRRPLPVDAVTAMEKAYGAFTEEIGQRQEQGCARIDETATALHDIATVYKRVDGQG